MHFSVYGGRPQPDGHLRSQTVAEQVSRHPGVRWRPATHLGQETALRGESLPLQEVWPVRYRGVRHVSPFGHLRGRHGRGAVDSHRLRRTLPGHLPDEYRARSTRQSFAGVLDGLRPGNRERKLAGLRGVSDQWDRGLRGPPELVQRIPAGHLPGDASQVGRRSHCRFEAPGGNHRRTAGSQYSTAEPLQPAVSGRTSAEERPLGPDEELRIGVSHADDGSGSPGCGQRAAGHPGVVRTGQQNHRAHGQTMPDGPPPGGAGRALRADLLPGLGFPSGYCGPAPAAGPGNRPAHGGPVEGSQAAGPAGSDPGCLGRRIRAHSPEPAPQLEGPGARTQQDGHAHVVRRRRREGRHGCGNHR